MDEKKLAEGLRQVVPCNEAEAHKIVLIGACARDLRLHNVPSLDTLRATKDIDLAVRVKGWEDTNRKSKR